ncbi:hypothetical protein OOK29_10090 [Streptomyces phaeochromogenes]|uniref:hypothetical protein n=1 Tax=Streptomyces phaeochromogenes TaxID=1923 RepID=UPI00225A3440|nr:hypothetical protein [Streptomyces phaeochromogenes]MCX5598489.1 hypothetical protein [Streptomyces phaeochromogenes]
MTSEEERRKQHRHRHKQRVLRGIDDELATDFDAATHAVGSDRSNITRQLWEWFVGRPGAQLPERPAADEQTDAAT